MTNKTSKAGLILGILSIIVFPLSFILGIIGLILSLLGLEKSNKNNTRKGIAIGGLVCSAIGIFLSILIFPLLIATLLGGFPGIGGTIQTSNTNINNDYWMTTDVAIPKAVYENGAYNLIMINQIPETIKLSKVNFGGLIIEPNDFLTSGSEVRLTIEGPCKESSDVIIDYTDSVGASYSFAGNKPIRVDCN